MVGIAAAEKLIDGQCETAHGKFHAVQLPPPFEFVDSPLILLRNLLVLLGGNQIGAVFDDGLRPTEPLSALFPYRLYRSVRLKALRLDIDPIPPPVG